MGKQLGELNANPKNPRSISDQKLERLKHSIAEFGDLSGFVYNRKTKRLVSGHQRQKSLPAQSKIIITKSYETPTPKGTVAVGYVSHRGERLPYREVSWPSVKEKAANLAANRGAGEWDERMLSDMMREIDEAGYDLDFTMFDEDERADLLVPNVRPSKDDVEDKKDGPKKRMECPACGEKFVPGWK